MKKVLDKMTRLSYNKNMTQVSLFVIRRCRRLDSKSEKKRELILRKAKEVFVRNGFKSVTMKDIIEECGISRGGIYLYFSSVDEIFLQVILEHNKRKLKETQDRVLENKSFRQLIDDYLSKQKNRLMNMDGSLLKAMHEYRFSHKSEKDKEFYNRQLEDTKEIIMEMLRYGVKREEISGNDIETLVLNIMFFIEGISTIATSMILSEEMIISQLEFIKYIIFNHKGYTSMKPYI